MPAIFFAGYDTYEFLRFLPWSCDVRHICVSYADYIDQTGGEAYFLKGMDLYGIFSPQHRILLDSGAFSAFKTGYTITVEMYARFLELYGDQFWAVASLDDKASQRQTYENYRWLVDHGFLVGPVWHAIGGRLETLEEYMSDPNVPMVFIGTIAKERDASDNFYYDRLDSVFHLVGKYHKPVHAFGRTEAELFVKYPFTSGDSITWANSGRYGLVLHWNHIDRTLRNIKIRNPKAMADAFGPRAKVLLGQLHDAHNRPLYHIQTAHNIQETLKEENDLEKFWQYRGVTWDYDVIDFKFQLSDDFIANCRNERKKKGVYMPGDDEYERGMYAKYLLHRKNYRPTRKWEEDREIEIPTTFELLRGTPIWPDIQDLAQIGE